MRFSHSLQLNAVPEWIDCYVIYDELKKLIFQLEKEKVEAANEPKDAESTRSDSEKDGILFLSALDTQLEKIVDFYGRKESELFKQFGELVATIESCPADPCPGTVGTCSNSTKSPTETLGSSFTFPSTEKTSQLSPLPFTQSQLSFESRLSMHSAHESRQYIQKLMDLRERLISLYISLSELESYVNLNRRAFAKITKKYDKVLDDNICQSYIETKVNGSWPFAPQTAHTLRKKIERVEHYYATLYCGGNQEQAMKQMKAHLRSQVAHHRNSVWREIAGQEKNSDVHVPEPGPNKTHRIPFTSLYISTDTFRSAYCFLVALLSMIILLNVNIFGNREENYCFSILIFAAIMWATEAVPLYATSLLLPFLIVLMSIMRNPDGSTMPANAAAKAVFASMFSGTIMMLLSGFALAAALSKYGIAKAFASRVLSRAGTRPRWVLLVVMSVALFLSMWISNVATPVLCFSLIDPILRTLPDHSPVAPCLLLGIALASCIGGMASPISSPQNIITLQYMNPNPGWGIWFGVALPIAILSVLVAWAILLLVYRPDRACPHLNRIKPTKGKVNSKQVYVMLITIATIALWCAETAMDAYVGDAGVIAAVPLFMFFGTNILNKDDLHAFLWSVVVLAQGGMALGNAVTSSGLLEDIALRIKDGIQNLEVIVILCIFSFLILVFATFVSHTVAALIIVPIVQQIGQQLPIPRPNLLVLGAGLACSAGMGLPVSGFPNMSAIMQEDASGRPYLKTKDFLMIGIPTSIVCTLLVVTLGYGIMSAVGY